MVNNRYALLICTDKYSDQRLPELQATISDSKELAGVLRGPIVGNYNVKILENMECHKLKIELEKFFKERKNGDLSLIYFACHGKRGPKDGLLYLTAWDTSVDYLNSTGISTEFIDKLIVESQSKKNIIILDCCFSGRYTESWRRGRGQGEKDSDVINVTDQFHKEEGTVIIASSSKYQQAYEIKLTQRKGEKLTGIFTSLIIEGLSDLRASRSSGIIKCSDLIDYIKDRIRKIDFDQSPEINILKNDLVIAGYEDEILKRESSNSINVLLSSYLELGHKFLLKGDYSIAIGYYNKAIEIAPTNYDALYNKANCLKELKEFEKAIGYYNKAIEIAPTNYDALYNKADCFFKQYKINKSIETYKKILSLNSNDNNTINRIAEIYDSVAYYYYYTRWAESPRTDKYGLNLCRSNIIEYCKNAIHYYEQSIKIEPNDYNVYLKLVSLYNKRIHYEALRGFTVIMLYSLVKNTNLLIDMYEKSIYNIENAIKIRSPVQSLKNGRVTRLYKINILKDLKQILIGVLIFPILINYIFNITIPYLNGDLSYISFFSALWTPVVIMVLNSWMITEIINIEIDHIIWKLRIYNNLVSFNILYFLGIAYLAFLFLGFIYNLISGNSEVLLKFFHLLLASLIQVPLILLGQIYYFFLRKKIIGKLINSKNLNLSINDGKKIITVS